MWLWICNELINRFRRLSDSKLSNINSVCDQIYDDPTKLNRLRGGRETNDSKTMFLIRMESATRSRRIKNMWVKAIWGSRSHVDMILTFGLFWIERSLCLCLCLCLLSIEYVTCSECGRVCLWARESHGINSHLINYKSTRNKMSFLLFWFAIQK